MINKILNHYIRSTHKDNSVVYIGTISDSDLISHLFRAAWYIPYIHGTIHEIFFLSRKLKSTLEPPEYMKMTKASINHIHFVSFITYLKRLRSAKIVIRTKKLSLLDQVLKKIFNLRIVNLDTKDPKSFEYARYCDFIWRYLLPETKKKEIIEKERDKFVAYYKSIRKKYNSSFICGNGPSIENTFNFEVKNLFTIACNSAIKNRKLLDHLDLNVLCAGDPISHLGVSNYAAKFRDDLIKELEVLDFKLISTLDYCYHLYIHYPHLEKKTILIPRGKESRPNFSLNSDFFLPELDSTFNIHMAPIAGTLTQKINLIGLDGKDPNPKNNEDFWAHSKTTHYHDLVDSGHLAHPTFKSHREKSTYDFHKFSLDLTFKKGEECGIQFNAVSHSFFECVEIIYSGKLMD